MSEPPRARILTKTEQIRVWDGITYGVLRPRRTYYREQGWQVYDQRNLCRRCMPSYSEHACVILVNDYEFHLRVFLSLTRSFR